VGVAWLFFGRFGFSGLRKGEGVVRGRLGEEEERHREREREREKRDVFVVFIFVSIFEQ